MTRCPALTRRWQVQLSGSFKPIGPVDVQQTLEQARQRGDDEAEVSIRAVQYVVTLQGSNLRQRRKDAPGRWREVRRVGGAPAVRKKPAAAAPPAGAAVVDLDEEMGEPAPAPVPVPAPAAANSMTAAAEAAVMTGCRADASPKNREPAPGLPRKSLAELLGVLAPAPEPAKPPAKRGRAPTLDDFFSDED